jgi:Dicer dimerisation domain
MSWRALVRCGWDAEAARAAIASAVRAESGPAAREAAADAQMLRPRFLTRRVYDAKRRCTVFQATVHLPRFCAVKEVTGRPAFSCRAARENVALEAIKQLHAAGELDDHLRPHTENRISEFVAAARGEDWLESRLAGDRISEGAWATLQTWRKPPDMRIEQKVPLALDTRAAEARRAASAAAATAAPTLRSPSLGSPFWIYAFQITAAPKAGTAGVTPPAAVHDK